MIYLLKNGFNHSIIVGLLERKGDMCMSTVSQEIQDSSLKSLESTLNKLSNAYESMTVKGSNTTLVKKRRNAVKIGLESLKNTWNGGDFCYDEEIILISKEVVPKKH